MNAMTIRKLFAPVTRALIEDANITNGEKVLDVAGGAGEAPLTLRK
jgi:ubiquinone/menaquinone biosynthesis C-methylase UbiE